MLYEFSDLVGQEPKPMRVLPSPAAISRMEETLSWTLGLDLIDGKIIWMRAYGERWKTICWAVGLSRVTAHRLWEYALSVITWITWRLNGRRPPAKRSQRFVVERAVVRSAR